MSMKKIVGLTAVILILVGVMLSEQAMAQKATPITKTNMASLKGTWQGQANFGPGKVTTFVLRIDNEAPPFKGNAEFQNLPPEVGFNFPGNFSNATSYSGNFDNGMVTDKGNFIITGEGGNFGEFSLVGKDLDGWFYLWGTRGTMKLKKK